VRFADHDAAGIVRLADHDAAGIARIDDARRGGMRPRIDPRRVKGGLKPTPAMPGMDRWRGLATDVASSG